MIRRAVLLAALACVAAAPPGASSCTGCHLPGGIGMGALQGRDAADLVATLEAFRSGARPATLMGSIVKGFSPDEVRALAAWFSAQP